MQDPFVGTWTLNTALSEFDANHRPTAGTVTFEIDEQGRYLMQGQGTNASGDKVVERPQRFIPDGKEHPIPNAPGLKAISTQPDANTLTGEARREDGSVIGGGTYVVSADGKTLTATNFGFDAQLREFKQRTVWERAAT
jgi:hypothetical protein